MVKVFRILKRNRTYNLPELCDEKKSDFKKYLLTFFVGYLFILNYVLIYSGVSIQCIHIKCAFTLMLILISVDRQGFIVIGDAGVSVYSRM